MPTKMKYFLPVFIFIFIITFHYFEFYSSQFLSVVKQIIPLAQGKESYSTVQSIGPYKELYKLSATLHSENRVFFYFFKQYDRTIDYNSTYYKSLGSETPKNVYLSELSLMVQYFFYPRIVPIINAKDLAKHTFKKGDYLISDTELAKGSIPAFKTIFALKDEFYAVNNTKRESYFIYQIN